MKIEKSISVLQIEVESKSKVNLFLVYVTESWILYRGHDSGLSDIVHEAYINYGDMEFGTENDTKPMEDEERHVKLVSIGGNEVNKGNGNDVEASNPLKGKREGHRGKAHMHISFSENFKNFV